MLVTAIPDEWLPTTEPGLSADSHLELAYCTGITLLTCPVSPGLELPSPNSDAIRFSPARRPGKTGLRQQRETGTIYKLNLSVVPISHSCMTEIHLACAGIVTLALCGSQALGERGRLAWLSFLFTGVLCDGCFRGESANLLI